MKWFMGILLVVLIMVGCSTPQKPVQLHPTLGTSFMIVTKGTQVGEYEAPEDGVFRTIEVLLNSTITVEKKDKGGKCYL